MSWIEGTAKELRQVLIAKGTVETPRGDRLVKSHLISSLAWEAHRQGRWRWKIKTTADQRTVIVEGTKRRRA